MDEELTELINCISDAGSILPSGGTLNVGSSSVFPYPYYDNTVWITPYYNTYTPPDKSFLVAKKLLEKKLVQIKSVKQFIELVEAIREIL